MKKIHSTLPLVLCLVFLSGCAELFQGKVPMKGNSNGTLSGMLSSQEEISELSTPEQLFVSKGKSPTDIEVTWSSVTGAVSYRLERAIVSPNPDGSYVEPDESLFEVVEQAVYGTNYTDTVLSTANSHGQEYKNRYYYRVSAENSRKKYSPSPFCSSQYGTLFAAPQNVRADLGESTTSITVRWNAVQDAASYEIWRGTNSSGSGSIRIASVSADRNQYTNEIPQDEQGTEFYYTIYAQNRYNNSSAASSVALGYALVEGAPPQPQEVHISDGRGTTTDQISIVWSPVQSDKEVTYTVYRTSSTDTSFSILNTTTGTDFTDKKSLKPGVYYYYQIQASVVDESGTVLKSKFSASGPTDENPAEGFILSPPATVFAEKEKGKGDIISWTPAIGSNDEQMEYIYEIYGDSSQDGEFTNLLETVSAVQPDEQGYIRSTVQQTAGYYKIRTTRTQPAIKSNPSTVTAPSPFPAESTQATRHANLDSEHMAANSSGVYPVKISWAKPVDDNPAGYHVYRSTNSESGFRKLTEEPIAELFYIDADDTTKAGKKYYYKILSVNALGQGSMYSNVAEGYGALTHDQYMREYNKTLKSSHKKLTLMHKSNDMDKLGSETKNGTISGSVKYNASIAGLGADITMYYDKYADFYIDNNPANGIYFCVTGNTDTSANMSANGSMSGTMVCTGMYPGKVYYDNIEIKGGAAGGGTYGIEPEGFARQEVSWTIGEE